MIGPLLADVLADIITTPEGGGVRLSLGLSLGAVRAPVSPPPPPAEFPAPVAYWPLDGDGADATGGADLTPSFGSASYQAGQYGQGLASGPSLRRTPQDALAGAINGTYSLSFWFKVAGGVGSAEMSVYDAAWASRHVGIVATFNPGGVPFPPPTAVLQVYADNMGTTANVGAVADGWHHAAVIVAGGNARAYLDGSLKATVDVSGVVATFDADGYVVLSGSGDDAAVWDVALTADQVAELAAGTQTVAQIAGL